MSYQKVDISRNDSLFSFEISSIAYGHKALNKLTSFQGLRVIEASVAGAKLLILAIGAEPILKNASEQLLNSMSDLEKQLILDHELITNISTEVIEAVYSLPQVELEEALIVVESKTVSGLLRAAQSLVEEHSLKTIEIKVLRSGPPAAYGFFTGGQSNAQAAAEAARVHLKSGVRQGRVEVVEAPTKEFRSFFNLSGQ